MSDYRTRQRQQRVLLTVELNAGFLERCRRIVAAREETVFDVVRRLLRDYVVANQALELQLRMGGR